jgi:methylmalonyl-CoA mutase N-terminal domain/subunit
LAQAHIKFVHIIAADEEQAGRLASDTNRGFGKISSFDPYNSLLCGRRAGSGFAPNSKRALAAGLNAHYYLSGAVSQVSDNPALQLGWHFAVVRDLLKASTTQLRIEVEYTLGSDMFANIAAIRALRFGLQQLLPPASFSIVTTPNRLHYLDEKPESNLIRSAYMQLSALLGGADCCLAGGYSSSAPEATPNLDELRLAANQIHLLLEECHIGAVADPVSGSPFFDQYTTLLLAEANRFLAEIEAQGSITECLRTNSVQKRVLQSQIELHQRLSSGNKVVVGLNKYRWAEHKPARIADYQARLINEAYAPLNPLTVQQLAAESLSEYANARSN